jgi:hypothetical protein
MAVARELTCTSTPIFSSWRWAYCCSLLWNGGSTEGAPSSRTIRASWVLIER